MMLTRHWYRTRHHGSSCWGQWRPQASHLQCNLPLLSSYCDWQWGQFQQRANELLSAGPITASDLSAAYGSFSCLPQPLESWLQPSLPGLLSDLGKISQTVYRQVQWNFQKCIHSFSLPFSHVPSHSLREGSADVRPTAIWQCHTRGRWTSVQHWEVHTLCQLCWHRDTEECSPIHIPAW